MNFGNWIVVAFVLFAGFIASLVTVCMRQSIPLVTKEYYQEELVYQDQIARVENANQLDVRPEISIAENSVVVHYDLLSEIKNGELKLFRPSDAALDQTFVVDGKTSTQQSFPIENPAPGLYRAKLKWEQNGKQYFVEEIVIL